MTTQNPSRIVRSVMTRASVNWRLAAAVAAVPLLAALPTRTARAQFPVQSNGHARDANNQVGSGGFNNSTRTGASVTNNNIIYNNVTGNGGFRGGLQETDPLSFRGINPGFGVDRFTAISNPAAVRGTPSANTAFPTVQPFYGTSQAVAPQGFVSTLNNTGYVPAGTAQASSYNPGELSNGTTGGSFRTGAGNFNGTNLTGDLNPTYGLNGPYAPFGTQSILIGPNDASNQATLLAVSPGFGIQQLPLDNSANNSFNARMTTQSGLGAQRFQPLDPVAIQQIRLELETGQSQNPSRTDTPDQASPNQLSRPLAPPLESPANGPLRNTTLDNGQLTAEPLSSSLGAPPAGTRTLVAPGLQTPLYDELNRRLASSGEKSGVRSLPANGMGTMTTPATPAPGRATPDASGVSGVPAVPGSPTVPGGSRVPSPARTPGSIGGAGTSAPAVGGTGPSRSAENTGTAVLSGGTKTEPVHVNSLATGVKLKAMSGLLQSAEDLMKQGKYTTAVEQYKLAQDLAPNNPLIPVGQAIAELGTGSFRTAEQRIRWAFNGDPALLHAQYDLNAFLGDKRLATVTGDLKDLAAKEPTSEMPAFLLAFISYNSGHEADAVNYLQDVEKREGRADPIVKRMRDHWNLPQGARPATPTAPSTPAAVPAPAAAPAPSAKPAMNK